MRRLTEGDLTIVDGRGRRYPPRPLAWRIAETVVRSLAVVGVLYLVGLGWGAVA
ncbi:hypothetical protein [Miltoncostaea marina]|uniref:hypothetical protein n=1 Tax=Miltoncostaea marina TaxID=2843215 RepID=UPI001C3E5DFF|nr:hypothetical protein [Miltoncostaea marina]